jgi:FkbM family methyltransferase
MNAQVSLESIVERIDVADLDPRVALNRVVEAYRADPLFCIPHDARRVFREHGPETEVILLGATPFSRTLLTEAHDRVRITAVVDDFRAPKGDTFEGLPIITAAEMLARARSRPLITVSGCRYDRSRRHFKNLTREAGVPHLNFEQAMRLFAIAPARDHRVADWAPDISRHLPEFLVLADRLVDDYSRFTLYSVLLFQMTCNPEWSLHAARPYCTLYFRSGLWAPTRNERFVDCGASVAESAGALIDVTGGSLDRIWMIEPDRFNIETLEKFMHGFDGSALRPKLALHGCAVSDENTEMNFVHQGGHGGKLEFDVGGDKVPVRRLDDLLDAEPTLIKMDIEGSELAALRGAAECIRQARPKLAISAYHRGTDLIDLAKFVHEVRPDYRVGLRHHTEERWDTCLYFY